MPWHTYKEGSAVQTFTQVAMEKWVRVSEVADHLDVSASFINKAALYTDFPVHRIGRNLRFRLSEVDLWVAKGGSSPV
jgi:excisionase family DNA binding protein